MNHRLHNGTMLAGALTTFLLGFSQIADTAPAPRTPLNGNGGMMRGHSKMGGGMMGNDSTMRGGLPAPQPGQGGGSDDGNSDGKWGNLNDAERQQVQAIQVQTHQRNLALSRQIRTEQAKLNDLIQAPKPDPSEIDKAYDRIDRLRQQIAENSAQARQRVDAIVAKAAKTHPAPAHRHHDQRPSMAMGMEVNRTFCARCHVPPNPMQHTAEQWPMVVDRMQQYMHQRGMRMPDPVQAEALLEYLKTNAYPSHAQP